MFAFSHITLLSKALQVFPADADDIKKQYEILLGELKTYNPEMLDKNRLIAITKSDMLDDELTSELTKELDKDLKVDYLFISSIANKGIDQLKDKLWLMLNN